MPSKQEMEDLGTSSNLARVATPSERKTASTLIPGYASRPNRDSSYGPIRIQPSPKLAPNGTALEFAPFELTSAELPPLLADSARLKPMRTSLPRELHMGYAEKLWEYVASPGCPSVYPGLHFRELAKYLLDSDRSPSTIRRRFEPTYSSSPEFVILQELQDETNLKPQGFRSSGDFETHPHPSSPAPNTLLFMRGYPSPRWLNVIGERYHVDPRFFQCHLSSLCEENNFDRPSLPSSFNDIIRLRIITIGQRDHEQLLDCMKQPVEKLQEQCTAETSNYQQRIKLRRGTVKLGDSIARDFSVFDDDYFALEQDVTACICRGDDGWTGNLPRVVPET